MKNIDIAIRIARKIYQKLNHTEFIMPNCNENRIISNSLIYKALSNDTPCMIARLGTTETITVNNYLCITKHKPKIHKIWDFISDKTHTPWWFEDNFKYLNIYSGVFPPTKETSQKFAEIYLNDIPEIDILGSFQYHEKFMPFKKDCHFIHLETLYPFFVKEPWTKALKNKKVLIIHPFEKSIIEQYKKRLKLFKNPNILPEFDLLTLKAIQSAAGIKVPFKDWFEALEYMKNKINKIDFDICILGCGAYGLPLAAYIKRMGKKAIHLGGGTQLLFGIKGKRWDDPNYGWEYNKPELMKIPYCSLYNEDWIKPLHIDTPETANKIDNACYW